MSSVLIVIPCYRESGRLGPFLDDLANVFSQEQRVRILVVEDGSGTEEQEKMKRLVNDARTRFGPLIREPLMLERNAGKGGDQDSGGDEGLEQRETTSGCG